jgi:2-methylcitrate dehydratase PrpD
MPDDSRSQRPARMVAEFAHNLTFEAIPGEVVEAAKEHLLDALGVGLAAASLPGAKGLAASVAGLGDGGQSTAFGLTTPLPAASAEQAGASGAELLAAYIAGWEVFVRLGLAAPGRFQARGFQITAVGGPFIAALIGARLGGLDAERTVMALGIAGSQSSGIFEYLAEGATVKSLHPGWAAHAGLVAVALAKGGMTGPSSVFDGRFGFYRTFAGDGEAAERFRASLRGLGREWHLPSVALKAFPCCHYIHPFLECLAEVAGDNLAPDAIASITCFVPPEEAPIICDPWERKQRPVSGYDAKFSLPYCLAAQLVDGAVDVDTFTAAPRGEAIALCERIAWSPLPDSGFPDCFAARLELRTTAGEVRVAQVDDVRGGPRRPLQRAETEAKFRANAGRCLSEEMVERTLGSVLALDGLGDARALGEVLRRSA